MMLGEQIPMLFENPPLANRVTATSHNMIPKHQHEMYIKAKLKYMGSKKCFYSDMAISTVKRTDLLSIYDLAKIFEMGLETLKKHFLLLLIYILGVDGRTILEWTLKR